jgi:tetratricopeptide (TPR) repeat protein
MCCAILSFATGVRAQGSEAKMPGVAMRAHGLPLADPLAHSEPLPDAHPPAEPVAPVISVRELQLPAAAMKEFRRSEKSISSRDFLSAADHLKKALRIEPDFVQAHNNLGATYMELEKFEDAITEFKKTIELDPKMEAPYRNMSLSLFELGRYSEAEAAARQAVALNPQHGAARYTLGRALAAQGSTSAETEELLRGTLAEFPEARLPLAEVLLNRCASDEAAAELRSYLASPSTIDPEKRRAVQIWLGRAERGQVGKGCSGAKPSA